MKTQRPRPCVVARVAALSLRRTCAAFGLDQSQFTLDVRMDDPRFRELYLEFSPVETGDAFGQRREIRSAPVASARLAVDTRAIVEDMVRNVALAFRPSRPAAPMAWSLHPLAASIVAAAGTALPNPADPLSWLQSADGCLHLPDGGNIEGAAFDGRQGVLLLRRASIVDPSGRLVASMGMSGSTTLITLPPAYPDTLVDSLAGHPAKVLCDILAADPRGAEVLIADAYTVSQSHTVIELMDTLVPLSPSIGGRERWRPRTAKGILSLPASRRDMLRRLPPHAMLRRYGQAAGMSGLRRPAMPPGTP